MIVISTFGLLQIVIVIDALLSKVGSLPSKFALPVAAFETWKPGHDCPPPF